MRLHASLMLNAYSINRLRATSLLLAIVLFCLGVGFALASPYQLLIVGCATTLLIAILAWNRPGIFGYVLIGMLLIPFTWSPTVEGIPTPIIVLVALPGALAGAARLITSGRLRLCVLDYLVAGIFVSALVSESVAFNGVFGPHTLSHREATGLVIPYVAFRLVLAAWPHVLPKLAGAFLLTGAALTMLGIWEEIHGSSPFVGSQLNNPLLLQWERNYPRAGGVRAQATLGHPIALGSLLIIPLVFAFAQRRWTLFSLLALGEALTLSRGPFLAAVGALCIFALFTRRIGRLSVMLAIVIVLVFSIGPVRNSVLNSFQTGTAEQALLTVAAGPGVQFTITGQKGPFVFVLQPGDYARFDGAVNQMTAWAAQ